jgi:excisionase family DNA binding protein
MEEELIGTVEASKVLDLSINRIAKLIREGRLPAKKIGNAWAIRPSDLDLIKIRKTGYPKGKKRSNP